MDKIAHIKEFINRNYNDKDVINSAAINTDFKDIDNIVGGLIPGEFVVIGGRPAMGKTTFALNMAVRKAIGGVPVAYVSTCQNEQQLLSRALSIAGDTSGNPSSSQYDAEKSPLSELTASPFFLYFNQDLTIDALTGDLKQFVRQNDIKVVYVDYLQFIAYNEGFDANDTIGKICFLLKKLAVELQIIVIAISELNRNLEHREGVDGKIPQLSDLRGSCVIEELADIVLMVHRPEYFGVFCDEYGNDLHNLFEIIISKNSFGNTGKIKLCLNKNSGYLNSWNDYQKISFS